VQPVAVANEPVPVTGWIRGQQAALGLSFPIPKGVSVLTAASSTPGSYSIVVASYPAALSDTAEMNAPKVCKDSPLLSYAVGGSEYVTKAGSTYIKSGVVLGDYTACDIQFLREVVYYRNGTKVIVSFNGSPAAVAASLPIYFHTDPTCASGQVWNFTADNGVISSFYNLLSSNQGQGAAQTWFNESTAFVKTISVN
jgi:hypothetical protein